MATLLEPPGIMEVLTDGVLLHNISWSTYESLLRDHPDAASPRFTYDRGEQFTIHDLRFTIYERSTRANMREE